MNGIKTKGKRTKSNEELRKVLVEWILAAAAHKISSSTDPNVPSTPNKWNPLQKSRYKDERDSRVANHVGWNGLGCPFYPDITPKSTSRTPLCRVEHPIYRRPKTAGPRDRTSGSKQLFKWLNYTIQTCFAKNVTLGDSSWPQGPKTGGAL
jgi:hypothetical protein